MEVALLKFDVTGLPIMNVNMRVIPVYKKVMERVLRVKGDADGRKKLQNIKEMAFIHLYTHFQLDDKTANPYWKHDLPERLIRLKKDLDMPEDWVIDPDLAAAIDFYKEQIVMTDDMEMLDAAQYAARQTAKHFRNVDYNQRDLRGNPLYKAKDVMSAISDVDELLDKLEKAKERVEARQKKNSSKVRGGGEIGSREIPKNRERDVR